MDTQERQDLHNPYVNEDAARAGRCGKVHMDSGRTCIRPHKHSGSCDFRPPAEAEEPPVGDAPVTNM